MAREREQIGVNENQLTSSWRTLGKSTAKFFSDAGSWMSQALSLKALPSPKDLWKRVTDYAGRMRQGAIDMWRAFRQGNWSLFNDWARENPFAAGAGIVAVGLAGGVVAGAITGVVGAVGGLTAWATSGSTGVMALLKGGITLGGVGTVLSGLTVGGRALYNFEWQETDEDIDKAIDQAITNLYEPMTEWKTTWIKKYAKSGNQSHRLIPFGPGPSATGTITFDDIVDNFERLFNANNGTLKDNVGSAGIVSLIMGKRSAVYTISYD